MSKRVGEITWSKDTPRPACGKVHKSSILQDGAGNRAVLCRDTGVEVPLVDESEKAGTVTVGLLD
jgi:hypothetical protein